MIVVISTSFRKLSGISKLSVSTSRAPLPPIVGFSDRLTETTRWDLAGTGWRSFRRSPRASSLALTCAERVSPSHRHPSSARQRRQMLMQRMATTASKRTGEFDVLCQFCLN